MKFLVFVAVMLPVNVLADYAQNGPLSWTQTSQSVISNQTSYTYDLYVPNAAGPFPVVAVGHGFNLKAADMAGYGKLFASRGNIVAIPNFGAFNSNHTANGQVMLAAIDQVVSMGAPGQPLAGLVDGSRQVVAGHSAGGLSAFLAASSRPAVSAVLLLDAVDTTLGGPAAPAVQAPVLFLFSEPSACNAQDNSEAWYASVGSQNKAQLHVVGATHCDVQDPISADCTTFCPGADAGETQYFKRYASGWLQYFVSCDAAAREAIDGSELAADVVAGAIADAGFVDIALPAFCLAPGDAGADAGARDAGPPDAGETDAGGTSSADSGSALDASQGSDAGSAAAPAKGCGCGASSAELVGALLVLALLAVGRASRL